MYVNSRTNLLEDRFAPKVQPDSLVKGIQRVIISEVAGGPPDLAKATAKRTLCPDGTLLEVIDLKGASSAGLDTGKLEAWLRSFPVLTLEAAQLAGNRGRKRDNEELGDSVFRDPAKSKPAQDPQQFREPLKPSLAPFPLPVPQVKSEASKEVTVKPTEWPWERRDPIAEEMTSRENQRLTPCDGNREERPHWARRKGDPLPG
ncbi:MAG: hypothetical protein DMG57_36775 [Acidobacteria bacterium]|nr:MAG: hypothetical protein DMG57_36775 [Acidobacteriota bacterium]